eukprot:6047217-Pleurochrysis_carterae.AAC.2
MSAPSRTRGRLPPPSPSPPPLSPPRFADFGAGTPTPRSSSACCTAFAAARSASEWRPHASMASLKCSSSWQRTRRTQRGGGGTLDWIASSELGSGGGGG